MQTKLSENAVSLSDLKSNPEKVIGHISGVCGSVQFTSCSRGIAMLKSLEKYEKIEKKLAFTKAVVEGLTEIEKGNSISLSRARRKLGLW